MSSPLIAPPPTAGEPIVIGKFFPNTAYVHMWRVISIILLVAGALGLLRQAWQIFTDLGARYTWPSVEGEVVSAQLKDDESVPGKTRADKLHTHYWVEYEVRFALAEAQCKTGVVYAGPASTMPCVGSVRTRSTRSPREAYEWLNQGYRLNAPVKVRYEPNGPEIKIEGDSIRLRYRWGEFTIIVLWVIGFVGLLGYLQRRLEHFKDHPETETVAPESGVSDKYKLTSLDLS